MKNYLKKGDIIGCSGYTDLSIDEQGNLELASTEGGELDYYNEETDTHYPVSWCLETRQYFYEFE